MSRTIAPSGSQARLILIGTALLLTLGMGMRQSFGLFLTPVTHDLAVTAADFTLALAVQNIVWGLSQALVGAIADRFGLRITMMAGAAIYVVGLGIMAAAQGALALIVSGGLIGVALSCTATSLAMTAVRACGLGGAAEHDARCRLRGRIARHPRGAARHPGPARARAVADRGAVFRAAGGRDAAGCLLGRRRRQDSRGTARPRPRCARCSARRCGTGRFS